MFLIGYGEYFNATMCLCWYSASVIITVVRGNMEIEVKSINELKNALNSGASEIVTYDEDLVRKLKAIKLAKSWGPAAVGGIIAAIPLVVTTGPFGATVMAAAAPTASITTATIIALVVAIGGTIAINLFTDWDYVELPLGIKMERRK